MFNENLRAFVLFACFFFKILYHRHSFFLLFFSQRTVYFSFYEIHEKQSHHIESDFAECSTHDGCRELCSRTISPAFDWSRMSANEMLVCLFIF